MNKEKFSKISYTAIGILLIVIIFFIGNIYGQNKGKNQALLSLAPEGVNIKNEQLEPFWKVWGIINDKYVEAKIGRAHV